MAVWQCGEAAEHRLSHGWPTEWWVVSEGQPAEEVEVVGASDSAKMKHRLNLDSQSSWQK
jgi:hypothetical protein